MDLVIQGGTVVTADSTFIGDIGIRGEKIAQMGGEMAGQREVDAAGKLVFPGGVDMHVHMGPYTNRAETVDDFLSGTGGAAAGGNTTVGNITLYRGPSSFSRPPSAAPGARGILAWLEEALADASSKAIIDFTLHPVIDDPSEQTIAELPRLADMGFTSIKIFMVSRRFEDRTDEYVRVIAAAGDNGILTMVHCEDGPIINFAIQRLLAQGKGDARYFPDSRPICAEAVSVTRAAALAEATGSPVYIVHTSSADALDACRRARARGLPLYVETRPIYLYLTRERFEEPDAARYVGYPPLRTQQDVDALWDGLAKGDIQTLCTDHVAWSLAQKLAPGLDVSSFPPGMANMETRMPMLYSEGVVKGRISINRFVELTCTNPAKLFGLFPQKGTIGIGADADIVVWDPDLRRTIHAPRMNTNADFDAYEGWEVQGWPICTISRGQVVHEEGRIVGAAGRGRVVQRRRFQGL
ncbi:MAG: dihydropyrimidinase [Dehalococcoidia bacterium]